MSDFNQGCWQKAWTFGAGAGVFVALCVMGLGHQGLLAGLFLGVVTFLLFGGFLVWAFCDGSDIGLAPPAVRQPAPVTPAAKPVVPAAAAPAPVQAPAAPVAEAAAPVAAPAPAAAVAAPVAPVEAPAKAEPAAKPAVTKKAAVKAPVSEEPAAPKKPRGLKAPRKAGADDLKLIEGIGPKLEERLNEWGIFHFDQIAKWGAAEVAYADENVPRFKGRCSRDKWVAQAKIIVDEGLDAFLERAKTNDY